MQLMSICFDLSELGSDDSRALVELRDAIEKFGRHPSDALLLTTSSPPQPPVLDSPIALTERLGTRSRVQFSALDGNTVVLVRRRHWTTYNELCKRRPSLTEMPYNPLNPPDAAVSV